MTRVTLACSKASRAAKRSRATRLWARIPPRCFATSTARACSKARAAFPGCNPIRSITCAIASERYRPVRVPGLPPLVAGAIGYFAYDMVRLVERIPDTARDDVGMDDAVMMFFLGLVVFDHVRHRVWIVRNVFTDGEGSLRAKYNRCRARNSRHAPPPGRARGRRTSEAPPGSSAQDNVQFHARALPRCRAQGEGIHSRGRHFSGCHQPAVCREDRRRSV